MVELQPNAIPTPPMNLIMKLVPLGGEHCQMLHVSPCQMQAVEEQHEKQTIEYFQTNIKEKLYLSKALGKICFYE